MGISAVSYGIRIVSHGNRAVLKCFPPQFAWETHDSRVCVCLLFWEREGGGGGSSHIHGHKESYKDINLKNLTSEWDSYPRPHEY